MRKKSSICHLVPVQMFIQTAASHHVIASGVLSLLLFKLIEITGENFLVAGIDYQNLSVHNLVFSLLHERRRKYLHK